MTAGNAEQRLGVNRPDVSGLLITNTHCVIVVSKQGDWLNPMFAVAVLMCPDPLGPCVQWRDPVGWAEFGGDKEKKI